MMSLNPLVALTISLVLLLISIAPLRSQEERAAQLDGITTDLIENNQPQTRHILLEHREFEGFELAFPKPIDSLEAVLCEDGYCRYQFLVAGWFWQPTNELDLPYTLVVESTKSDSLFSQRFDKYDGVLLKQHNVYLLQYEVVLILPIDLVYLQLDLRLFANHNNVMVSHTTHLISLIARNDVHIMNHERLFSLFLQVNHLVQYTSALQGDVEHKQVLDFIEIGTSDFSTVLQQAEILSKQMNQKVFGISMEPILQFQNNLPDVDGVFKLNAAVKLDEQIGDIVNVYYLTTAAMKATLDPYIRGCFQVGKLHPYVFRLAVKSRLPAHVLQKTAIKSYSISNLLQQFVFPSFHRIKLVKLDLEGLDQSIIRDMIHTYEGEGLSHVTAQWPCVLHFETNIYGGFQSQSLVQELQQIGYHIWDDVIRREEFIETFQSERGDVVQNITSDPADTSAFHCACPLQDYYTASELLLPSKFSDEFMVHVCKTIAERRSNA